MKQDFVILPREVSERALASLESEFGKHSKSASDIRTALDQPQGEQEPVAVARVDDLEGGGRVRALAMNLSLDAPLYTHPQPKREPLTDDELDKINRSTTWPVKSLASLGDRQWAELLRCAARAIEAAHNIKD